MKYSIEGEPLPVVICELEAGEGMQCENGAMGWMSPNMVMETKGGGLGKMFGRVFSGESLFLNYYTAQNGPGMIAYPSCMPGSIRAFEIGPGKEIIAQKKAFLAATMGVELSIHFQKKLGTGFFGGEGFIMERLSGQGMAFLEFDGYIKEYNLQPGQQIVVDTGYTAAMDASVNMEIRSVGGVKNALLGGEGFFNTVLTGPGRVWIQTMPVAKLAESLVPFIPSNH